MYCLYCKQRSGMSLRCVIIVAKRFSLVWAEMVRKWARSLYLTSVQIKHNRWCRSKGKDELKDHWCRCRSTDKYRPGQLKKIHSAELTDNIRGDWGWLEKRNLDVVPSPALHSSVTHLACQIRHWWKKHVTERHLVCRPWQRFPPTLSEDSEQRARHYQQGTQRFFFVFFFTVRRSHSEENTSEGSTQSGRLQRESTVVLNQSNQIISFPIVHLPALNNALSHVTALHSSFLLSPVTWN